MKVVTTVHKAGLEQYGFRWFESMKNWPENTEFRAYVEGFPDKDAAAQAVVKSCMDHPLFKGIGLGRGPWPELPLTVPRTEDVPRLEAFKQRYSTYKAPDWRHDIVRFSNKVFAAYDALYDHDGIGVWLDADVVTDKPIPAGYVEDQLGDAYLAHFDRPGHYTETGLWLMNCAHPKHREFLDLWVRWFEEDAFTRFDEWHDCTTLDATIRLTGVPTKSLSGRYGNLMHPMAKADFSRYLDHCKGARKVAGSSPERVAA